MEALKERKIKIIHLDEQGVASVVPLSSKKNGHAFLAFFTGADSSRNSAQPLPILQKEISLRKGSSQGSLSKFSATWDRPVSNVRMVKNHAQKPSLFPKTPKITDPRSKAAVTEEKNSLLISLRVQIFLNQMIAKVKKSGQDLQALFRDQTSEKKRALTPVLRQETVFRKNPFKRSLHKPAEIYHWVALEEKIVHDYLEQKSDSSEVSRETREWVALEEKIVHYYGEEKTEISPKPSFLPQFPQKQSLPVFETFNTQTRVPSALQASKVKPSFQMPWINPVGWGVMGLVVMGLVVMGLAIGGLVFHGISSRNELSRQITELQKEKTQLEQSYAETQRALENKITEEAWLNAQIREMTAALKTAQEQNGSYKLDLARVTGRYESQLSSLREDLKTKDSVIGVLKTQIQVLGEILDQAGAASIPGAASQVFMAASGAKTPVESGKISEVNALQGFLVVDRGSNQGVRSGDGVTVSREGVGLTIGRVDRVYSTMATVIVPNRNFLASVHEGDTVTFI